MTAICAQRTAGIGRVEVWRSDVRLSMSVAELVNPSAFMTGLSKLLPSMLEGNPEAPLIVERIYFTRDGDA
jgi:hypothetical protein